MTKQAPCEGCSKYSGTIRAINAVGPTLRENKIVRKQIQDLAAETLAEYRTHLESHTQAELIAKITR